VLPGQPSSSSTSSREISRAFSAAVVEEAEELALLGRQAQSHAAL
jgi:hypothetical protein